MDRNRNLNKLFVGGGKTIGRLPKGVVLMLDAFIESGEHIIVGDAQGCDCAFQVYLHTKGYPNVTVYCSGTKCRHNIGGWEVRHIDVPKNIKGYKFYREKDYAMLNDCDYALLVYERRSLATRSYIHDLKKLAKPVFAFDIDENLLKFHVETKT